MRRVTVVPAATQRFIDRAVKAAHAKQVQWEEIRGKLGSNEVREHLTMRGSVKVSKRWDVT
eukprot:69156-Lingulodinium_polyedra.AAC.1